MNHSIWQVGWAVLSAGIKSSWNSSALTCEKERKNMDDRQTVHFAAPRKIINIGDLWCVLCIIAEGLWHGEIVRMQEKWSLHKITSRSIVLYFRLLPIWKRRCSEGERKQRIFQLFSTKQEEKRTSKMLLCIRKTSRSIVRLSNQCCWLFPRKYMQLGFLFISHTSRLPVPQQLHWWASQGQHLWQDLTLSASSTTQTLCQLKCPRKGERLCPPCRALRARPRNSHEPRPDLHLILWSPTALIGVNRSVTRASLLWESTDIITLLIIHDEAWDKRKIKVK